jgi:hypothetical protein
MIIMSKITIFMNLNANDIKYTHTYVYMDKFIHMYTYVCVFESGGPDA